MNCFLRRITEIVIRTLIQHLPGSGGGRAVELCPDRVKAHGPHVLRLRPEQVLLEGAQLTLEALAAAAGSCVVDAGRTRSHRVRTFETKYRVTIQYASKQKL